MSKKFYAINRETGERWKPEPNCSADHQYIVMYDSGYLAVVKDYGYDGSVIEPLDVKVWKKVIKEDL